MIWEKKERGEEMEQLSFDWGVSVREGVGVAGVSGEGEDFRFFPLGGPSPDVSEEYSGPWRRWAGEV